MIAFNENASFACFYCVIFSHMDYLNFYISHLPNHHFLFHSLPTHQKHSRVNEQKNLLEGDIWSESLVASGDSNGVLTTSLHGFFTTDGYRFSVSETEFRLAFPHLVLAFESLSLRALTSRMDALSVNERRERGKQKNKSNVTLTNPVKGDPQNPPAQRASDKALTAAFVLPPWDSSPEGSPLQQAPRWASKKTSLSNALKIHFIAAESTALRSVIVVALASSVRDAAFIGPPQLTNHTEALHTIMIVLAHCVAFLFSPPLLIAPLFFCLQIHFSSSSFCECRTVVVSSVTSREFYIPPN